MVNPRRTIAPPPPLKRQKTASSAVSNVVFDQSARADYLTGFHKRKQARIKQSQENAIKRAKNEKRLQREEMKKQRQRDLEDHVQAVNESIKIVNAVEVDMDGEEDAEGEGWKGLETAEAEDEEYLDEDQYATVTVEAVEVTKDGFVTHGGKADSEDEDAVGMEHITPAIAVRKAGKNPRKPWQKERPSDGKPRRKKSRNFKYESKEERKMTRSTQRNKNKKAAAARKARD